MFSGIITHKTLQGHLTNTKQSHVNNYAAQVLASSPKDVLKSTVLSCHRKAATDCSSLTKDGREFQARAAATGNARSPRVCRHIAGMISVDVAADGRRLQKLRLVYFVVVCLQIVRFAELQYYSSLAFTPVADSAHCDIIVDKPTILIKLDVGLFMSLCLTCLLLI